MTSDIVRERDPRWEWIELHEMSGATHWIKGNCRHLDVVQVEAGGAVVAHLCVTCDAQLPEEWRP